MSHYNNVRLHFLKWSCFAITEANYKTKRLICTWIPWWLSDKRLMYNSVLISREVTQAYHSSAEKIQIHKDDGIESWPSINHEYDLPNEINNLSWLLSRWARRAGGAALIAILLPQTFEAQETLERSDLLFQNSQHEHTFARTMYILLRWNKTIIL